MDKEELIEYAIKTSNSIKDEKKQDLIDYFYKQKEVINNFLDIVNKSKMLLNNPDLLDLYLKIKEVE